MITNTKQRHQREYFPFVFFSFVTHHLNAFVAKSLILTINHSLFARSVRGFLSRLRLPSPPLFGKMTEVLLSGKPALIFMTWIIT